MARTLGSPSNFRRIYTHNCGDCGLLELDTHIDATGQHEAYCCRRPQGPAFVRDGSEGVRFGHVCSGWQRNVSQETAH